MGYVCKSLHPLDWCARLLWYHGLMCEESWPILTMISKLLCISGSMGKNSDIRRPWYQSCFAYQLICKNSDPQPTDITAALISWAVWIRVSSIAHWYQGCSDIMLICKKFWHIRLMCKAALHIRLICEESWPILTDVQSCFDIMV